MSTRAVIARRLNDGGWEGVYHHWDGYPAGLGKTLWDMLHGGGKGLEAFNTVKGLLSYVIDEHPAGWSHLRPARMVTSHGLSKKEAPQCYCHGYFASRDGIQPDRKHLWHPTSDLSWIEWLYIFEPDGQTMTIMEQHGGGCREVARVDLNGEEPDWKALEDSPGYATA